MVLPLDDDFYHPNPEGTALIGRRKKHTYALAQYIMVQVERVDRFKRQIDFRVVLTDDRDKGKKPGKPFKSRMIDQARSYKSLECSPDKKVAKTLARRKPKKKSAQEKKPPAVGKVITKRPNKNQRNRRTR